MRKNQDGQALVAAMVIMLILFALAGGVAVAASGLLQQGRARGAAITDLSRQSAVADAVSQVAGTTTRCGVPPSAAVFPDIDADDLTALSLAFPDPVTMNTSWTALCVRVDHVVPPTGAAWANLTWRSNCGTVPLPAQHVTTFFDARVGGKGGLVYVDDQPSAVTCLSQLPSSACSATNPQPHCVQCGRTINANVNPVVQATLDCDLSQATAAFLHVVNSSSAQSPARAFTVGSSTTGGSAYLIATHLGTGNDYEESVLLVPASGANQLLYKAPLP
jgi:hypothetical protein